MDTNYRLQTIFERGEKPAPTAHRVKFARSTRTKLSQPRICVAMQIYNVHFCTGHSRSTAFSAVYTPYVCATHRVCDNVENNSFAEVINRERRKIDPQTGSVFHVERIFYRFDSCKFFSTLPCFPQQRGNKLSIEILFC